MGGRHVDMTQHIGKKYNYLEVLSLETEFYLYKGKSIKKTFFNCKCECGVEKKIAAGLVLIGSIKSCGCKKMELVRAATKKYYVQKYLSPVEDKLFGNYKTQAKKHNRDFLLSKEEFDVIVNANCYYCGTSPDHIRGNKTKSVLKVLNGIDRIDSSKGYTTDNTVSCCPTCNRMKLDHSNEDFLNHIKKILDFQNKD